VEFAVRVRGDLARLYLAAAGHHLLGGKPDAEVQELDEPGAVEPPEETELLDRQKYAGESGSVEASAPRARGGRDLPR
jgi:DNA-binding IclR family transcriptional regulator